MSNVRIWAAAAAPLVLIACASGGMKTAPMPDKVNIQTPSVDLPSDVRAFSGKWTGRWIGGGGQLDGLLIVEKIDTATADVVYSNGENDRVRAGWRRVKASLSDGTLRVPLGNASATYKLQQDGTLAGTYSVRGFNSTGTFTRAN